MLPINQIEKNYKLIDLNQSYDKVQIMMVGNDAPNKDELLLLFDINTKSPEFIPLNEYQGKFLPDFECFYIIFSKEFEEYRKLYYKSKYSLFQTLLNTKNRFSNLKLILDFLKQDCALEKEFAEGIIKLLIAKGDLQYIKNKSGEFIFLTPQAISFENKKRFLQGITDEIIAQSNRIELLIQHSQTKGNYRELLLRKVLQRYLPKKYSVVTGFVEGCKRQCDIIIYDSENFSPLFKEEELVVVPLKSVRALIEVKTELTSSSLRESLELIWDFARFRSTPTPIFKGIFAFRTNYKNVSSIAKFIKKFYHENFHSFQHSTRDIQYLYESINSICIDNRECLLIDVVDYYLKDDSIRPRVYSLESMNEEMNIYNAFFFSELFSFLDTEKYSKKVNTKYFRSLSTDAILKKELCLYESNWTPPSMLYCKRSLSKKEALFERASTVSDWKMGTFSIQDLEKKYNAEDYHSGLMYKAFLKNTTANN